MVFSRKTWELFVVWGLRKKCNGEIRLEGKMKISICMYARAEVLGIFVLKEKSERI